MEFSWLVARTSAPVQEIEARANKVATTACVVVDFNGWLDASRRSDQFRWEFGQVWSAIDGSHEEGPRRLLEGGDGTVGVWGSGLEMGEDLCRGGPTSGRGRGLRGRAASQQCRADAALAAVESFPDALEGSVASGAVGTALMAAAMLPATACWRNVHRLRAVRLRRRILSASQTLKVRPQPGRVAALLQKMRRARSVRCGSCCRRLIRKGRRGG